MTPEQLAEAMEMGADALSIYSDTDCRDAMIRRVEALPRYFPENEFDGVVMAQHADGYWLRRAAVLAALREGGDDGR